MKTSNHPVLMACFTSCRNTNLEFFNDF